MDSKSRSVSREKAEVLLFEFNPLESFFTPVSGVSILAPIDLILVQLSLILGSWLESC